MLAQVPVPNAFAYGSPLTGSRVAVTPGLLTALNTDEVEAVLGHELGHLRHHDVQVMMAVSVLPSVFMYLGYSFMWSGMASGGGSRRSGGGNGNGAIIGIGLMGFGYLLTFFTLWLSRVREYYADRNSVQVVDNGAWKLSTGLAKIVSASKKTKQARGQGPAARRKRIQMPLHIRPRRFRPSCKKHRRTAHGSRNPVEKNNRQRQGGRSFLDSPQHNQTSASTSAAKPKPQRLIYLGIFSFLT